MTKPKLGLPTEWRGADGGAGAVGSVGRGRKRCRRCALPPQSKTLRAGWHVRERKCWRVGHVAAGHRPALRSLRLRRALSLPLL